MFRQKLIIILLTVLISITSLVYGEPNNFVLGGSYLQKSKLELDIKVDNQEDTYSLERFFRPSNMPILNTKQNLLNIDDYNKNPSDIIINKDLLKSPQDTIINYFSVLREAANPLNNTHTGCGSLGESKGPYPYAYNFLSKSYRYKISYKQYIDSFKNQLHINLIKLNKVPSSQNNDIKYFVELEVIEGTNKPKGVFAYYYGYIYLEKEDDVYKIKNMEYYTENYLCAPYHSWYWDAKSFVEIEYGNWCSLIDGNVALNKDGYEKKVYFTDKNKNEYYVLFYELTNGVDIKIADYKKNKYGKWEVIYIDPSKCLKNRNNF